VVTMSAPVVSWTLLGSGGGLAKAVLAVFNRAAAHAGDPLHGQLQTVRLHLIDKNQKDPSYYRTLYPVLYPKLHFHRMDLSDTGPFRQHLINSHSRLVIDLSWADTLDILGCCDELGIPYVNSALENTAVDEDATLFGFPLTERFERFERKKPDFTNTKAIICSGMNPGVVQWMAYKLLQENPGRTPLACYVVEHDSSFYADSSRVRPNTLYTSWSPECFLDEAILSYPMLVRHQIPMYLYEEVYAAEYRVRLGDKTFYGCLMPHEEVLTLGRLREWETGFLYRVSEYTTEQIRCCLDDTEALWDWDQEVIEPSNAAVEGEDLVGVLFVYENEEKYLYNTMSSSGVFPVYRTNATYLQVACGVYAAAACLVLDTLQGGVYDVYELLETGKSRYEHYLTLNMKDFVRGTNPFSDGLLHRRRRMV
jgi:hypothetical protein